MHGNNAARLWALVIPMGTWLAASPAAEPPKLDFEAFRQTTTLSASQRRQLADRIGYWLAMLAGAKEGEVVVAARTSLMDDCEKLGSAHEYTVASLVAEQATKMLAKDLSELKALKETNVALIVSQIPRVAIQPALEKMVRHPNPAVRYYGWGGYRQIRTEVFVVGRTGPKDETMYRTLRERAKAEASVPVLEAIFRMAQMPYEALDSADWQRFRKEAFAALKESWAEHCRKVLPGDRAASEACRRAVLALRSCFRERTPDEQARTGRALQMLLEMAWCSAKAYDVVTAVTAGSIRVRQGGKVQIPYSAKLRQLKPGEYSFQVDEEDFPAFRAAVSPLAAIVEQRKEPKDTEAKGPAVAAVETNAALLEDCERTIQYLSKRQDRFLARPLNDPDVPARGAAVRRGVLLWVEALKDLGVTNPGPRYWPNRLLELKPQPAPTAPPG